MSDNKLKGTRSYLLVVFLLALVLTTAIIIVSRDKDPTIITQDEQIIRLKEAEHLLDTIPYIIEGDSVYFEDDKVFINVTPHTSNNPVINFTTKSFTGDIDIVFGFDTDMVKPVSAKTSPHYITTEQSYICEYEFNYTLIPKHFWCYNNYDYGNGTSGTRIFFEHDFSSGNVSTKTAYWNETSLKWNDVSGAFNKLTYDFLDYDTWYYKKNISVVANVSRLLKIELQTMNLSYSSYKYFFGVKPSSETLSQAIANDHFYYIDPWTAGLNTDILSYYKFDEATGTLAEDSTRNGYNATLIAGGWGTGKINGATALSSEFGWNVTKIVPHSSTQFSINAWVNLSVNDYNLIWGIEADGGGAMLRGKNDGIAGCSTNNANWIYASAPQSLNVFHMQTCIWDSANNNISLYVDGVYQDSQTFVTPTVSTTEFPSIGSQAGIGWKIQGNIDELGVWNRSLTSAEVTQLYNSGTGISYTADNPVVNIIFPVNNTVYNESITNLNYTIDVTGTYCWYSGDNGASNSTTVVAGTNFTISTNAEWNNFTVYCNNSGNALGFNTTDFFINKSVGTTLIKPTNAKLISNTSVLFEYNNTVLNTNLTNATYYLWFSNSSLVTSKFYTLSGNATVNNKTIINNLGEADYIWNVETCGNDVSCNFGVANYTFELDNNPPTFNLTYPLGDIGSLADEDDLFINWTLLDNNNIKNCSYTYNGTTTNLVNTTCVLNYTTINYSSGKESLSMIVYDNFNNSVTDTTSWVVSFSEISQTYNSITTEGSSEDFSIRFLINPINSISLISLIYNSTTYASSVTDEGSNIYNSTYSLNIPQIGAPQTVDFYWQITFNDSSVVNSTTYNQTINNITLDDCGTNTYLLYNFSLLDEKTQEYLTQNVNTSNSTVKYNLQIYNSLGTTQIATYNSTQTNNNTLFICSNNNLSGGAEVKVYLEMQYTGTGYSEEFYYLQNETVNSSYFPTEYNLYLLNSSDAQQYTISYKDSSFLAVNDALIEIKRKYLDENLFKIVEIPKTNAQGETIGNLVSNDIIYTFVVTKHGIILGTFTNYRVECQNPTLNDCKISLNSFTPSITITDFEEELDLSYTLSHDRTARTTTFTYTVPSGTVSTFVMNVTKEDALGTFVCTDNSTSSADVLTCNIPASIGNSTVKVNIYRDNSLVASGEVNLSPLPSELYGTVAVFLAFLVFLTLMGASLSDNPIFTIIFMLVGILLLFSFNLVVNNGFIGGSATILFLIVAIILVIVKGGKKV